MSMLNYPSDFDIAYKGFQYPLPPSWKYAMRLEDQIQWLLQALLKVNDEAVSQSILNMGLADNLEQAKQYADNIYTVLHGLISSNYQELADEIEKLTMGVSRYLSPVVNGNDEYQPYINKELFNVSRPYAATYADFQTKYNEMTYAQAHTDLSEYTLFQLAIYGAVILGVMRFGSFEDVISRCKPYPIDEVVYAVKTPKTIHNWSELKKYGALAYITD